MVYGDCFIIFSLLLGIMNCACNAERACPPPLQSMFKLSTWRHCCLLSSLLCVFFSVFLSCSVCFSSLCFFLVLFFSSVGWFMLVLLTFVDKIAFDSLGMTDFYLSHYKLRSVAVFQFNKELVFLLYMLLKNWPKSNRALSIRARGTPGFNLSPLLFNLFMNDIPFSFEKILSDSFVLPNDAKMF